MSFGFIAKYNWEEIVEENETNDQQNTILELNEMKKFDVECNLNYNQIY